MRIGTRWVVMPSADEIAAAERSGAFGLWADVPSSGVAAAAELAAVTTDPRIVLRIVLGSEHPVTLAEEAAVLDHLSAGRVVCVVDTGALSVEGAMEDLQLLRACWSGRPVRHRGLRWQVPAGLADDLPDSVAVTPTPSQVDLPVWLTGIHAPALAAGFGLPFIATQFDHVSPVAQVQPGSAELSGEVGADRELVSEWASAGATHLLVQPPVDDGPDLFGGYIARYLQPEVAMPQFPRIMAEAELPSRWVPA
jgi:alkanesulfonate monooxygenase SsuD/methylene tetrahydromethanopterin reductase-like flavin-dependent oxidoreductase (luciferase family)